MLYTFKRARRRRARRELGFIGGTYNQTSNRCCRTSQLARTRDEVVEHLAEFVGGRAPHHVHTVPADDGDTLVHTLCDETIPALRSFTVG